MSFSICSGCLPQYGHGFAYQATDMETATNSMVNLYCQRQKGMPIVFMVSAKGKNGEDVIIPLGRIQIGPLKGCPGDQWIH